MTQAINLANFANNLNNAGQVDPLALSTVIPISKGGTNASTIADARISLGVPSTNGANATGNWNISISGNANTSTTSSSTPKLVTNSWIVEESGGVLQIKTAGGALKFTMDAANGLTVY